MIFKHKSSLSHIKTPKSCSSALLTYAGGLQMIHVSDTQLETLAFSL